MSTPTTDPEAAFLQRCSYLRVTPGHRRALHQILHDKKFPVAQEGAVARVAKRVEESPALVKVSELDRLDGSEVELAKDFLEGVGMPSARDVQRSIVETLYPELGRLRGDLAALRAYREKLLAANPIDPKELREVSKEIRATLDSACQVAVNLNRRLDAVEKSLHRKRKMKRARTEHWDEIDAVATGLELPSGVK